MTRVALAHDVLAARAGGERVLIALANAFPSAPIHTLIHEPAATFGHLDRQRVKPGPLNRSRWLRHHYRHTLPIAGLSFWARKIDADVTICSTSGLSHHVRTTGAKIVYCHTPARWLHDADSYLQGYSAGVSRFARVLAPPFTRLDQRAMRSATRVLANSNQIASEISQVYDLDATVVPACSTLDVHGPVDPIAGIEPGFVLTPARPLGYKRLDVLAAAATRLPDRQFLHIGEGPHRQAFVDAAPANLTSVGAVSESELRWAYRNAQVVALTGAEDFGLVPLEAAAFGVHTVGPDARGLREHDRSNLTGYAFGSASGLAKAIKSAPQPSRQLDASHLGVERFAAELRRIVEEVL